MPPESVSEFLTNLTSPARVRTRTRINSRHDGISCQETEWFVPTEDYLPQAKPSLFSTSPRTSSVESHLLVTTFQQPLCCMILANWFLPNTFPVSLLRRFATSAATAEMSILGLRTPNKTVLDETRFVDVCFGGVNNHLRE